MKRCEHVAKLGSAEWSEPALTADRAPALVQVRIDGPVLLLMGPIGLFFARFCRYLRGCGISVTKVAFPLQEFGFPREV